ncbi:MAG: Flp pilus assembly complex ATPase component TadA [Bdellovibrionaceae bacterium]|nr:Flp pilus assembly complex ATPase component TadA [Pseudobdellovibrionaceae bacterium]
MFGDYLVSKQTVTLNQLNEALRLQKFKKSKIGRLLVELGYINQAQLDSALFDYIKPKCNLKITELIELKKIVITPEDIKELLISNQSYVIKSTSKVVVFLTKVFSDKFIQEAESLLSQKVILWVVEPDIFSLVDVENRVSKEHQSSIIVSQNKTDEQKLKEENPYAKLIRESVDEALIIGASDIHYEPFDTGYIIRFRVHGILREWKVLEKNHIDAITAKLKSIINMDLATIGKPQDSRATFKNRLLDIRASSFPVVGSSEKIVLRLQRQDQKFVLEELGLSESSYQLVMDAIQKQDGLILISGPTGSGKTTTLYSLLSKMDKVGKNISTLENPVEMKLDRINQANVGDYNSFADFQRALMRQDPDIILVGEVRDKESAELCMKLSATGHLVLSTIHANGAIEVVERLKNLGVDEYSIRSNLRLSVAQRLAKKLCQKCSIKANDNIVTKTLKFCESDREKSHKFKVTNTSGCEHCQSGVVGRVAIIEYLEKEEISNFILSTEQFTKGISLKGESLKLATQGIIDINEVLQFT